MIPSVPTPPFRYPRQLFLALSATGCAALLIAGRAVLLPFLLAALLAFVLFPAVNRVERLKIPRSAAILIVYAITIGSGWAFFNAVVPRLFAETKSLSAELPRLTRVLREEWLPSIDRRLQRWSGVDAKTLAAEKERRRAATALKKKRAPIKFVALDDGTIEVHFTEAFAVSAHEHGVWRVGPVHDEPAGQFSSAQALRDALDRATVYAQRNSLELLNIGRTIVATVSRGVFYFFLTLMLAGYMMYTYENIHQFFRQMWPAENREALDRFLRRLDRGLSGVVRGQLLICLVNGILSAIGFWIFDLKYWPILSLLAAMMSIIPIFGSILSSVPAVAIGLTQGYATAGGVLIWILAIHQLEANFLNPKIIGDAAHIHPVLVVFSLLLGEHFFQITGALLAVPCLALVQTVFLHFRESVLGIPTPRASVFPGPLAVGDTGALIPIPRSSVPPSFQGVDATEDSVPPAPTTARSESDLPPPPK